MLQSLICRFHQVMRHTGEKHWCKTLKQCYCHPKLRYMVDMLKCEYCQKHRLSGISYRSLPELVVWIVPWKKVVTDLIGLWTVKDNNRKVEFNVFMCINAACKLVELICLNNKMPCHIRDKFVQCWLAWYLHPMCCVPDKGSAFLGGTFQWILHSFDIKDVHSTRKNLQLNLIYDRIHQTVGNIWQILKLR